ncbi:sulfur carrier protein ThiS [Pararhizobium haloflavum]|uniref:sulfur carrier protein ThiS n=1 Tax=Pararhizobium haloflavum TaxID=2037914 RepID=UPI000C182C9C|nr:sulfur carrier protein ThiS [Pararhizobium haloflavum]
MQVIVNGRSLEARAATLAALVDELGYSGAWFATAINGDFVPGPARPDVPIRQGDRIEILSPMQGG